MRIQWKVGIAIASFACASAVAHAQPVGAPPDRLRGGCGEALAQTVGLTAAQRSALETVRQQTADTIQPIADQIAAVRDQVEMALAGASPDRCAIGDLEIQANALRTRIQAIVKNAEGSFVATLTGDQQAQYATFVAAHPGCGFIPARGPGLGLRPAA